MDDSHIQYSSCSSKHVDDPGADMQVVVVGRRQHMRRETLRGAGYLVLDVTAKSDSDVWGQFAPSHPHGGIPVPGWGGALRANSVEGVWQALKVFETEGFDPTLFHTTRRHAIQRNSNAARGSFLGHLWGAPAADTSTQAHKRRSTTEQEEEEEEEEGGKLQVLLNAQDAHREIYVPAYEFVLRERMGHTVTLLMGLLLEGQRLALVDNDVHAHAPAFILRNVIMRRLFVVGGSRGGSRCSRSSRVIGKPPQQMDSDDEDDEGM